MTIIKKSFKSWPVIVLSLFSWTECANFGSISLSIGMNDGRNEEDSAVYKGPCPPNTACVPMGSCPLIGDLLDVNCFSSDKYFHRLNQLTCGNFNGEDYVCCPSCDCGRVYQVGTQECGQSMVRGIEAGLGAHPWVARVGFTNKDTGNIRFPCAGTIISKRVVLTAAHCALAKPDGYKLTTVVVGEYDVGRSPDCNQFFCAPQTQAIKIDHVVAHPNYEDEIFKHDIALIMLRENIQYSVAVAPICLNEKTEVDFDDKGTLVGWGKLSGQANLVSRQQQLKVPIVSLSHCDRVFGDSVPVTQAQLCAGGEAGKDACSGFGGAPLLYKMEEKFMQIGIVSFGSENCGSEGVPSVYTNIAHYYKWIIDNAKMEK